MCRSQFKIFHSHELYNIPSNNLLVGWTQWLFDFNKLARIHSHQVGKRARELTTLQNFNKCKQYHIDIEMLSYRYRIDIIMINRIDIVKTLLTISNRYQFYDIDTTMIQY